MDPILEIKDLVVQFHTLDGVVHAVNGVSYAVAPGETLGVVGESGCGKTVTALSVMRLVPQPPGKLVGGQAWLAGRDLLRLPAEEMRRVRGKEIAMVFQDPMNCLNPVLTVGDQISEAMMVHLGLSAEAATRKAIELLELVGIPHPAQRIQEYPHQFSGGMRQRAMLAMALACSPAVLIADEPTTALDVTIQAQIIDLVKSLRARLGMAIVWITHDLGVVAELADRVAVMYAGYVVEMADVFAIFEAPCHPYTVQLLRSLPRMDQISDEKLAAIPGAPPDCLGLPPGCPFAPRCEHTRERCRRENPPLVETSPGHQAACWVDLSSGKERA